MGEDYLSQPINIGSSGNEIFFFDLLLFFVIFLWNCFYTDDNTSARSSQQRATITSFSPYLNYDPRILQQSQPEFIFPEGASKNRGRFEFAFSQIGSAVIIGAGLGGSVGLYNGIVATNLAKQTGKLRRTQWDNKEITLFPILF